MDNIFGNQSTDGMEGEKDFLGGGGTKPTGVYDGIIKAMFTHVTKKGATGVTLHLDINGFEYRETQYVLNREGKNTYQDKNDATKKHLLPGWLAIDSMCMMATGFGLKEQDMEEKVFKLWDSEQKAEVNKNVPTMVNMIGKPLTVALLETIEDVTKINDSTGKYEPTGKTRKENEIVKSFHTDSKRTTSEVKAGLENAVFYEKWKEKNEGKEPKDNSTGTGGKTGTPGASDGAPAANAEKPKTSLFK